jgi:hypothetical protein
MEHEDSLPRSQKLAPGPCILNQMNPVHTLLLDLSDSF